MLTFMVMLALCSLLWLMLSIMIDLILHLNGSSKAAALCGINSTSSIHQLTISMSGVHLWLISWYRLQVLWNSMELVPPPWFLLIPHSENTFIFKTQLASIPFLLHNIRNFLKKFGLFQIFMTFFNHLISLTSSLHYHLMVQLSSSMLTKPNVMPLLSLLGLISLYIFLWRTSVLLKLRDYGQFFNLTFPSNRRWRISTLHSPTEFRWTPLDSRWTPGVHLESTWTIP